MYKSAYSDAGCFEWDPRTARANLAKHGVSLAEAVGVLGDPLALTVHDEEAADARFVTVGRDDTGRLLVVVYAWRDNGCIRILSAREATRRERRQYEGGE